ncbi:hypothetical protein ACPA0F_18535 [Solibacillus silvestris]
MRLIIVVILIMVSFWFFSNMMDWDVYVSIIAACVFGVISNGILADRKA